LRFPACPLVTSCESVQVAIDIGRPRPVVFRIELPVFQVLVELSFEDEFFDVLEDFRQQRKEILDDITNK